MKNVLILLFLVFCCVASGQIINFPDAKFKNALVNTKCVDIGQDGTGDIDADLNNDGEIDLEEALEVKNLNVSNMQISNLEGIDNFKNLEFLKCENNQIISLNAQRLIKITVLFCSNNQLNSLGLQGLTNLENLSCSNNQLVSLNLQGLTNLTTLKCDFNNLTSLDAKELIKLESLLCYSNKLSLLNIQGLKNLTTLFCQVNELTTLDLQELTKLELILCHRNKLSHLDVQGLTNLTTLLCDNNLLTFLNIKGTKLNQNFSFGDNPNLSYICCDEEKITKINNLVIANGQNCEVNSYCSFTPGGKFYLLNGVNKYDTNNNGCDDQDIKVPNIKYKITNGNNSGTFVSNSTGKYSIPLQEGTHIITPILENPEYFEVTPPFITVTFPNTTDTITQNFCITPKGFLNKINITIIPLFPPARPGFDASYKIIWENVGNQIESGTLNFTYDDTLLDYISATQTEDLKSDGIVSWYFNNLLPFEKREITVTLKVNRPTDTPAVNAGDKLYLTASILDNIFTLENTVVGSYDPNDKTCLQGDRVKPDMVGEYVDYLIRFENTGNYAAENVVVKDIIDTKTFDVSTLKIADASHEVYTRIEGNKVEFIFENINLPFDDANNDGYIAFKIKTLPSLVLGDSLKNLADIYFDYNFPIRTNEAQTTVAFPVFTKDITTEVNIYPNPVNDILYLDTNDNWTKAEIYDNAGRIMRSISLNGQSIGVNELESGTYFIRLNDGEKVGLVKFVKI